MSMTTTIKNYLVGHLAYHPPPEPTYTFNKNNMHYLIIDDLKYIVLYFQPLPSSGITLNTLGDDKRSVLLFSHGNADDLGAYFNYCRNLSTQTNCHVLTYDYFNYGHSSKSDNSEDCLLRPIHAVYKFLSKKNCDIFLVGKSIGTVPSIEAAANAKNQTHLKGLILISPLASGVRCLSVAHYLPNFLLHSCDTVFGNSIQRIKSVKCPVLFLHGLQDQIVPCENTSLLYDTLAQSNPLANLTLPVFFGSLKNPGTHSNLEDNFEQTFFKALNNFIHPVLSEKID